MAFIKRNENSVLMTIVFFQLDEWFTKFTWKDYNRQLTPLTPHSVTTGVARFA